MPPLLFCAWLEMKNAAATLKQKSKRPQRVAVELQERLDLTAATVDRKECVIKNVKICGKTSQNKHGMAGVTGTDYLPSFHQKAKQLYEGLAVNIGHPPKTNPDAERDPRDRNGVLLNVRVLDDETFGDWHLIPSNPMTPTFLDCAEKPQLHGQFALSHNAQGFGVVQNGRYQIAEPGKVRSVDAVTRGGCNRTLFEGQETPMPQQSLIDILDSAEPEVQARFAPLLSSTDDLMEDIGSTMMDAPAAGSGYDGHCAEMVKAIIMDSGLSAEEKLKKIKHALKILDDGKADDKTGTTTTESAETTTETTTTTTPPAVTTKDLADLAILRNERAARDVCESLEFFDATPIQIKAIAGLTTPADRKALAKTFKDVKAPAKKGTQAHTSSGRTIMESREKPRGQDKEAFAKMLLQK